MFNFPLLKNSETINVQMQDAVIAIYVFIIALSWPSSFAPAELKDGYQIK